MSPMSVNTTINEKNIPSTLDSFIKYVWEGIAISSRTFDNFTHYTDNEGNNCLVFTHRFGIRWSKVACASTHPELGRI
jgi:hypothetical protein